MVCFRFVIDLGRLRTATLSLHRLFGHMLISKRFGPLPAVSSSVREDISGLRHKIIKVLNNGRAGSNGLNDLGAGIGGIGIIKTIPRKGFRLWIVPDRQSYNPWSSLEATRRQEQQPRLFSNAAEILSRHVGGSWSAPRRVAYLPLTAGARARNRGLRPHDSRFAPTPGASAVLVSFKDKPLRGATILDRHCAQRPADPEVGTGEWYRAAEQGNAHLLTLRSAQWHKSTRQ
jgi:hypothetical protein